MVDATNQFGGFWTQQKIEIFGKYLFAYLQIMKEQQFELIYFDGFAGCGRIEPENSGLEGGSFIESVALQVLGLKHTKVFDLYYMVDKHKKRSIQLAELVRQKFPELNAHVVRSDCNEKLIGMAEYMRKNNRRRSLAFIDPFGMSLKWSSLKSCGGLGIDMWILIPTGVAVNRLLMKQQERIPESWLRRLEDFYGSETSVQKTENAVQRAIDLYRDRLGTIWNHVSKPFPMRNSTGSIMYHFLMATNYAVGLGIANEIIGKKLNEV